MRVGRYLHTPNWNFYGGFGELDRLQREMDAISNRLMGNTHGRKAGVFPLINLTEDIHNFYLTAELPGVSADEIAIEATGTTISVSGERKIAQENEDVKYHRREREAGKFSRMVSLSTEIDTEGVKAGFENGILKIVLPKSEKAKPRQITVR